MSTAPPPHPGQPDGAPHALGDLLSGPATAAIPEREWVGLLEAIAAGDMRALHALYERTHHLVFTLSMRITKSRDAAEEVTLDVFNDVWQRAATYDPAAGSVVAWIMMRARSIALNRLSLDDTKKPVSHNGDSSLPPTAATDTDEAVSLRIQGHLLRDALTVLPPAEREALKAAFFSESSYDDIAARVDQPSQTIASRIQSGLEKLRQALARTMGAR